MLRWRKVWGRFAAADGRMHAVVACGAPAADCSGSAGCQWALPAAAHCPIPPASMVSSTLAVVVTLASGAVAAISNKVAYQLSVPGKDGIVHKFTKAYLFTLLMFIGEALCLAWYHGSAWYARKFVGEKNGDAYHSLNNGVAAGTASAAGAQASQGASAQSSIAGHAALKTVDVAEPPAPILLTLPKPPLWIYFVLSIFDLTATTLTGIGNIYVSASTTQMLRGSAVLFTGLSSLVILKSTLTRGQWTGIGIVVLALGAF